MKNLCFTATVYPTTNFHQYHPAKTVHYYPNWNLSIDCTLVEIRRLNSKDVSKVIKRKWTETLKAPR